MCGRDEDVCGRGDWKLPFSLQGHIKLSDFGLCTGLKRSHRTEFYRDLNSVNLCKCVYGLMLVARDPAPS